MEPLDVYIHAARDLALPAFAAAYADPVLVLRVPERQDGGWRVFRTMQLSSASLEPVGLPAGADAYRVLPIRKRLGTPWRDRISLGRATNNDLVLMDASVSKLHATLVLDGDARCTLRDLDSSNGTTVRGKRLADGEMVGLEAGDALRIGSVDAEFHSPATYHGFLRRLLGAG